VHFEAGVAGRIAAPVVDLDLEQLGGAGHGGGRGVGAGGERGEAAAEAHRHSWRGVEIRPQS